MNGWLLLLYTLFYILQFSVFKNEYTLVWNYFNILKNVAKMPENVAVLFESIFSALGGHKVKGRVTTDHLQHHPCGRKWRGTKKPLAESESEKVGLKLTIQKTKVMAPGPITSWEIDGETVETVSDFIFGAPKSLQMVFAAMKLKDAYSLEGKLWPS